jgi:competence ComEA-like helix-hairpin-helix protein
LGWHDKLTWTRGQRIALITLLAAFLAWIAIQLWRHPLHVPDPQQPFPARYADLADRIDPNTATWEELAALPAIGEKRARDIVRYREDYLRLNPGKITFQRLEDLLRIKGIGYAMMLQLNDYLIFPAPPTTAPADQKATSDNS